MKKISLILMICLFSFINILFATSTDTAPFQTLFDTFAYYCNNLNETGLYSLFATDFLDNGEDSNSFIGMISNEILSMLGDDNKISFVVNSAELLSDTLAEVTFTMYIKQTSDSAIIMMEEADEPFTFKLIILVTFIQYLLKLQYILLKMKKGQQIALSTSLIHRFYQS